MSQTTINDITKLFERAPGKSYVNFDDIKYDVVKSLPEGPTRELCKKIHYDRELSADGYSKLLWQLVLDIFDNPTELEMAMALPFFKYAYEKHERHGDVIVKKNFKHPEMLYESSFCMTMIYSLYY